MNVLINTPDLSKVNGGVSNHYVGLRPFWKLNVEYNPAGSGTVIPRFFFIIVDYLVFIFKLLVKEIDLVVLNPSLDRTALYRDGLFLLISNLLSKRTIVFFHGWNSVVSDSIEVNPGFFRFVFNRSDKIVVLSSSFEKRLVSWGISCPIFLSTTKFDDRLISNFDVTKKPLNKNILFLARIEEEKGVFIALDAFLKLRIKHPDAVLFIAGEGTSYSELVSQVKELDLPCIKVLGRISGSDLIDVFNNSSIYILPTYHGEGMPTSILEAMAFGLAVVSRPVGGLNDFFQNEKMGVLLDSLEPDDYFLVLDFLLNNSTHLKEIGDFNHYYAIGKFRASVVAHNLEQIFLK